MANFDETYTKVIKTPLTDTEKCYICLPLIEVEYHNKIH